MSLVGTVLHPAGGFDHALNHCPELQLAEYKLAQAKATTLMAALLARLAPGAAAHSLLAFGRSGGTAPLLVPHSRAAAITSVAVTFPDFNCSSHIDPVRTPCARGRARQRPAF